MSFSLHVVVGGKNVLRLIWGPLLMLGQNERESFSSTFFNKTVELYHPSSEVDVSSMLRSLVGMLLVLGGLYFVYNQMGKKPERARASSGGERSMVGEGTGAWLNCPVTY